MNMKTRSNSVDAYWKKKDRERLILKILINSLLACIFITVIVVALVISSLMCQRKASIMGRQSRYDFVTQTCFIETENGKYVPYNQFRSFDVTQ